MNFDKIKETYLLKPNFAASKMIFLKGKKITWHFVEHPEALFTRDILAHNIAIKI